MPARKPPGARSIASVAASCRSRSSWTPPKVLNAAVRAFDHASGVELPWIPVTVSGGAPAASGLRPAQRAVQLLLDAIRMSVAQAKERQDTQSRRALLALRAEVHERSVTPLVSPGAK